MFGIGVEKKKVVGRVNERYHLNPHIDQVPPSKYPALEYEEPSVEYIAQVLEDLIIKSKKSFVFQDKLKDLIKHVVSNIDNDNAEDWQLLGEFIRVTKMEDPKERKSQLISFLKKAKALEEK